MRLIICGNGFDRHHGLCTSYGAYKEYLNAKAPCVLKKYETFPWLSDKCQGDLWKDVEQTLALNFQKMVDHYKTNYHNDSDGEIEYETDFEDWTRFIYSFTGEEFYKWISSIDICDAKRDEKIESIFSDAVFVTFNYTNTIEHLYGISSEYILHLRGDLRKVESENCFSQSILPSFQTIEDAECYDKPLLESDKWNSEIIRTEIQFGAPMANEDEFSSIFSAIQCKKVEDAFAVLAEKTTKKIYHNIPRLNAFLENKTIDEVIVMGHSMTGADILYYNNCIFRQCKAAKWIVYVHNDRDEKSSFLEKYDIVCEFREW